MIEFLISYMTSISLLLQLVKEVKELNAFKEEQAQKMTGLEKKLVNLIISVYNFGLMVTYQFYTKTMEE